MSPYFALCLAIMAPIQPQTMPVPKKDAPHNRCIVIVGTNDVHGAIEPETSVAQDTGARTSHGGVIAFSGYLSALREVYKDRLLLLDAGDIFQGTMPSNMSLGRAMITAYNALGYDAAAIGNHEFDYGAEAPLSAHAQAESVGIDRTGVLKSRIAEANFPFLAVNIDDKATQAPIRWPNVQPSILKTVGGIKVGIVGASTPSTPWATRALNVAELSFAAPGPRIAVQARALRQQGAELVILVAHMGGSCTMTAQGDARASCVADPGKDHELIDVLSSLPPGTVDVAVGGHTHQFMAHWLDGTAIIESGSRGQYLGLIEACVAEPHATLPTDARIDQAKSTIHLPIPLCLTTWDDGTCTSRAQATPITTAQIMGHMIKPDVDLIERMAPFLASVHTAMNQDTGAYLPQTLSASAVGALTAEAMRRQMRSDFGLHNAGGVRTGLNAGALTYGQIFEALPFDNYVTQVTLTGAQVVALAKALSEQSTRGRTTQFANLRVLGRGHGKAVVDAKGHPLQLDRLYTLSTVDFIVEGGDGAGVAIGTVPPHRVVSSELSSRDSAAAFISKQFAVTKAP